MCTTSRNQVLIPIISHKEVTIHGLGAMMSRAISMALAVQDVLENQVELKPTTETITLTDDIIPDDMVI